MTSPISSSVAVGRATTELNQLDKAEKKTPAAEPPVVEARADSSVTFQTDGSQDIFSSLSGLLDQTSDAIALLKSGTDGLASIAETIGLVRDELVDARDSGDAGAISVAQERLAALPNQIAELAGGAGGSAGNLLAETARDGSVQIASLSISLVYVDYTQTGESSPLFGSNTSADGEPTDPLQQLQDALAFVQNHQEQLLESLEALRSEEGIPSFVQELLSVDATSVDETVLTEEGASILSLQVRQELAGTTEALTPEARLNALKFFT